MKGISIVETQTLRALINRLESLENKVVEGVSKYNKPYLY
jgi:hypothetical protein